jgi:D-glycero-D-manno-heptose 1,7-bisphosphate phosphatase
MRTDYVKKWEELEILPGALDAIARITRSGRELIVLTNQSAISRNLISADVVKQIHERLADVVASRGGSIRAFLVCPHSPYDQCNCRKPAPGLFFRAREELGVDLAQAVMVGDQTSDVEAARAAGCDAILVDAAVAYSEWKNGFAIVRDLAQAADLICVA